MSVSIEWLILCVCAYMYMCVSVPGAGTATGVCVSRQGVSGSARLRYTGPHNSPASLPFLSSPYPSLCLLFSPFHLLYLSFSSPHDSILSLITFSLLHILFLSSYFLLLWPSISYLSLPLVPTIVLLFSALSFLCQVGVRSLLSQLANYNMLP